jgi:hypothetical protein
VCVHIVSRVNRFRILTSYVFPEQQYRAFLRLVRVLKGNSTRLPMLRVSETTNNNEAIDLSTH